MNFGKSAIVTQKNSLSDLSIDTCRFLIIENSKELYYENDTKDRYKIRDIQIFDTASEINNSTDLAESDFIYCKENQSLYYYTGKEFIKVNNVSVMTGATASINGSSGLVPAPTTAEKDYFLKGDGTWSAVPTNKKSFSIIGDGKTTLFSFTHNLNTYDVLIQVYDSNLLDTIQCTIKRVNLNTISVGFETAPSANDKYTVIVL
jgi:hypothetical protein